MQAIAAHKVLAAAVLTRKRESMREPMKKSERGDKASARPRRLLHRFLSFRVLIAIALLQAFCTTPALAEFDANFTFVYRLYQGGPSLTTYPTAEAACPDATAYFAGIFVPTPITYNFFDGNNCVMTVNRAASEGGPWLWRAMVYATSISCPGNSSVFGAKCVCASGLVELGQSCSVNRPGFPRHF